MVFGFFRKKNEEHEHGEPLRGVGVLRDSVTEVQPKGIQRWCTKHNVTVVGWARDYDCSPFGSLWQRPGLGEWLTFDPPKNYDVLIADSMDQVTFIQGEFVELHHWCQRHGKRLVLADGSYDSAKPIEPSVLLALFPQDPDAKPMRIDNKEKTEEPEPDTSDASAIPAAETGELAEK